LKRELGAAPDAATRRLRESLREPGGSEATPRQDDPPRIGLGSDELGTPETPLIGREPEMGRLRAALEEAAGGRGSVVTIVGARARTSNGASAQGRGACTHPQQDTAADRPLLSERTGPRFWSVGGRIPQRSSRRVRAKSSVLTRMASGSVKVLSRARGRRR